MRVITGKYKGRTLIAPKSAARPTLDRMKETLFNIIADRIDGADVLDLFAGSGQIAIECLSRGANSAIMCDIGRDAVAAINANYAKIGLRPNIMQCDFTVCLKQLSHQMDIVFADPPYKSGYYAQILQLTDEYNVLKDGGIVICEYSAEDVLPDKVGNLYMYDNRKIGTVRFGFYQRSK